MKNGNHSMKVWLKRALVALAIVLGLGVVNELVRASLPAEAKEFTAADLAGKPWTLSQHRGRGPIILSFFGLN
jgi:hypothetical protein